MSTLLTRHDPREAQRYYEEGLWRDDTFYSLVAGHADTRPDAFALRDSQRRLTWREVQDWTDAVAQSLHESGLRQGDRVAIWLTNRVEAVIVFLACARNGYICNPSLHQSYTNEDIQKLLTDLGAAAVFTETDMEFAAALQKLPSMRRVYRLPEGRDPGTDFPSANAPRGDQTAPDSNSDRICYLAFTSGTTGKPKGVMHSHNTLLSNPRDMVRDWNHDHDTVLLSLSPLSHHIAWVAVAQVLVSGGELVVNDPPEEMKPLDWIVETGATYVMGVPTHAMDILADQAERGLQRLGSVNLFYMAGAPIPPSTAQAFLDQGIKPQNIYGMTENSSHQYTFPDDDPETITGTCGRGGPSYRVKLFSQEDPDIEVPVGEVGQIGGKGACLMLGYFDNQMATESSFNRDGWFLSGDLGRLNEKGCLEIVGRLKDIIIRGGHNVHPAKIEDLAIKHAGVEKAAAFPVPDERLGEKVGLAIIPAAQGAPAGDELLSHLYETGLSIQYMPEYYIAMDALPLTASGKILKRELAAWAREGKIAPEPIRFTRPNKES
ncbi:MAG: class I adenylate-forming enzyme family protein [Rhodospirillaceae bacterium]|nr:class I adenylate-forming enzyme family protein [Rhodospirillaceae bacterium]